ERRWIRRLSERVQLLNVHPGGGGSGPQNDDADQVDPRSLERIVAYFKSDAGTAKMKYTLCVRSLSGQPIEINDSDILRIIRRKFGRFGGHDKAICAAVCQRVHPIARKLAKDIA